ncbi:MAG: hypothetical protein AMXMBFR84_17900 [Candidatus Hydrogenedentota bacterium]
MTLSGSRKTKTCVAALALVLLTGTASIPGCPFFPPREEEEIIVPGELEEPALALELFATGFTQPLFLTSPRLDFSRIFVVERAGYIWLIKGGDRLFTPFLDISAIVLTTNLEQGLLGVAFHPQYAVNGHFYITYVEAGGSLVLARYTRMAGNPNLADPASAKVLMTIAQPRANHKGGMIAFGPDGYLYFGTGDGGGDVWFSNGAQKLDSLLGKMLRIDVDHGDPYQIPLSNPFIQNPNAFGEIWAIGFRNPWRWSFDSLTGDLYIADVGLLHKEELNFQSGTSLGGQNYGWWIAEGFTCVDGLGTCGTNEGFTPPILDLGRDVARAITGGYVYRGLAMPGLRGTYFFGDHITRRIWSLEYDGAAISNYIERTQELAPPDGRTLGFLPSFGQDAHGELYLCDFADGEIYKIVPAETAWNS